MELPKFLLADNSEFKEQLFVIHTEYPRFILDVTTDDVEWLEELDDSEEGLEDAVEEILNAAMKFFDKEIQIIEDDNTDA